MIPPNLMVSVARAPADGSEATSTDVGYDSCVFAPIPGREAIVFGGPCRDSLASGSDIMNDASVDIYGLRTGATSTADWLSPRSWAAPGRLTPLDKRPERNLEPFLLTGPVRPRFRIAIGPPGSPSRERGPATPGATCRVGVRWRPEVR